MRAGDVVTVPGYPTRLSVIVRAVEGDIVRVAIPRDIDPDQTIPYRREDVRPILTLVASPNGCDGGPNAER